MSSPCSSKVPLRFASLLLFFKNHFFRKETWSGSFSAHGIASTRMVHAQIELQLRDTGKPPEKIERLPVSLLHLD
ncbi:hypothetical protein GW17_00041650 [Ensete ventricosum]|nr:hypothetical protein GW17_00041650 [Ensete ventricosum]